VAGAVSWMPSRAKQVDYSLQYLQGPIKVLVNKDSGIKSFDDLAGKKVCASSGSSSAAIADEVLEKSNVMTYQSISQCFLGLRSGKVAGVTAGVLVLQRFVNKSAKTDQPAVLLPGATYVEHIGMIVKKGEPELRKAINKAIRAIDDSGQLTKIYNKWIGTNSPYNLPRDFEVEPVHAADKDK